MEILNRQAKYLYFIEDTYEAGIVLTGTEIKSIRKGMVNLKDSYVVIKNGEAFILNMHISKYGEGNDKNHEETRSRKLLLRKSELIKLNNKANIEGYTIIPLKLYIKNRYAKVLIGVAKGKKQYDKKQAIKERDIDRQAKRERY